MQRANDEVTVVVQAEHIEAVGNIDAIVAVEGIDAVFIGPYDLSASMGRMGQVGDEQVQAAISAVCAACRRAGVRAGIFGLTAAAVAPYLERGFTLIGAGCDATLMNSAARELLAQLSNGR